MNPTESTTNGNGNGGGSAGDPLRTPMADANAGPAFDSLEMEKESKLPPGTAVLLLVVLIGAGAIFGMRQFGLGAKYSFDHITIDYPIDAKPASHADDDYERLLSDLTDHKVPHVEIREVRPRPFQLTIDEPVEDFRTVATENEAERLAREKREREAVVRRELSKLTLNSVIGGSSPIARISGQPVRPGDVVSDLFTIRRIYGRTVELEADGRIYTLTMGD